MGGKTSRVLDKASRSEETTAINTLRKVERKCQRFLGRIAAPWDALSLPFGRGLRDRAPTAWGPARAPCAAHTPPSPAGFPEQYLPKTATMFQKCIAHSSCQLWRAPTCWRQNYCGAFTASTRCLHFPLLHLPQDQEPWDKIMKELHWPLSSFPNAPSFPTWGLVAGLQSSAPSSSGSWFLPFQVSAQRSLPWGSLLCSPHPKGLARTRTRVPPCSLSSPALLFTVPGVTFFSFLCLLIFYFFHMNISSVKSEISSVWLTTLFPALSSLDVCWIDKWVFFTSHISFPFLSSVWYLA